MENRCEPGDIAVIVFEELRCIRNVGRLVRVHPTLKFNPEYHLSCWIIEPLQADPWYISSSDGSISSKTVTINEHIEHPDAWMLPFREPIIAEENLAVYKRIQNQIDQDLEEIGSGLGVSTGVDHV